MSTDSADITKKPQTAASSSEKNRTDKPSTDIDQLRHLLLAPQDERVALLEQELSALKDGVIEKQHRLQDSNDALVQANSKLERQLADLQIQVDDKQRRVQETSEVLSEATSLANANDESYPKTMNPIVVTQFHDASRNNPEVMAEALFPILGPSIRKMVSSMLSPDKKTEKYRVEQLFVIDKESGLPLCHASSANAPTQDAALVSGMLTAIQSFVHDAFAANEFDGLNTLEVGELSVWIEWGPSAVFAAVIRGSAPASFRQSMQLELERIHSDYGREINNFSTQGADFENLETELGAFIDGHDGSLKSKVQALSTKVKLWLSALAIGVFLTLVYLALSYLDNRSWNEYLALLNDQPGIVVVNENHSFKEYNATLLVDPLATDPTALIEQTNLNGDSIDLDIQYYQAIHPDFVIRRAKKVLVPPSNVELSIEGSDLIIEGATDSTWTRNARRIGRSIAGINAVIVR